MADYPLKQEAAEVQDILDGALLSNKSQAYSEETKAFIREKIGASAAGEGLKIISHFDTLAELEAAIPNPVAGEAYSVGTELPYNLYIFDFLGDVWRNYGPIRANDIKARLIQNYAVPVSAWQFDDTVFSDYTYKARISLAEITGNDFGIVGFSPADAIGGNFCPICYAFDGYVEIWAKTMPTAEMLVPVVTLIVQDTGDVITGNSTKGITNASGGIPTGGIGTAQIADGSVNTAKIAAESRTQRWTLEVGTDWNGTAAPYTQNIAANGMRSTDIPKVFFLAPRDFANLEAQEEAFSQLRDVESADGIITLYAKDRTAAVCTVLVEVIRI